MSRYLHLLSLQIEAFVQRRWTSLQNQGLDRPRGVPWRRCSRCHQYRKDWRLHDTLLTPLGPILVGRPIWVWSVWSGIVFGSNGTFSTKALPVILQWSHNFDELEGVAVLLLSLTWTTSQSSTIHSQASQFELLFSDWTVRTKPFKNFLFTTWLLLWTKLFSWHNCIVFDSTRLVSQTMVARSTIKEKLCRSVCLSVFFSFWSKNVPLSRNWFPRAVRVRTRGLVQCQPASQPSTASQPDSIIIIIITRRKNRRKKERKQKKSWVESFERDPPKVNKRRQELYYDLLYALNAWLAKKFELCCRTILPSLC